MWLRVESVTPTVAGPEIQKNFMLVLLQKSCNNNDT